MTIVRVGATQKYSEGWETAFGKAKKRTATAGIKKSGAKKSAAKKSAKKPARKSAKKRSTAKTRRK